MLIIYLTNDIDDVQNRASLQKKSLLTKKFAFQ